MTEIKEDGDGSSSTPKTDYVELLRNLNWSRVTLLAACVWISLCFLAALIFATEPTLIYTALVLTFLSLAKIVIYTGERRYERQKRKRGW